MTEVSSNPMRRALRALTHGVYVLGVHHNRHDDYLVLSLVTQCSVQPPRVALAISTNARILAAFRAAGGGALGILDATQLAAVRRYGAPGGVRHAPATGTRTSNGHPSPPEASFVLALRVHSEQDAGDHVLFVTDVVVDVVADTGADVVNASASAAPEFTPLTLANTGFPYAG